ncbi:MAG: hypothetical protein M5U28_42545 [Sandaracinaceae bacterium]|nr:hypothetical protein [Sandaracinaceae bacterium]
MSLGIASAIVPNGASREPSPPAAPATTWIAVLGVPSGRSPAGHSPPTSTQLARPGSAISGPAQSGIAPSHGSQ